MRSRQENCLACGLWIWIAFFAVFQVDQAHAARGLSRIALVGYSQWLQALDDPDAGESLYPYGLTLSQVENSGYDRRLMAARALMSYEESANRAWNSNDFASETQCLNNARSNREILDFEQALQWYRNAQKSQGSAGPKEHIAEEMFATAIMTRDSLLVLGQLLNTVGVPRLNARTGAVVLAYRHYLALHDVGNLGLLMEKTSSQIETVPAEVRYWHAFALIHLERYKEALPLLETLAKDARLAASLSHEQVAWFVRALPDLLYLQDRRLDALRLYRLLSVREDTENGRWARYQIANDLLLDGRYEEAELLLAAACTAQDPTAWQIRACELAQTVATLNEIRKEGVRYGTDGLHVR